MFIEGNVKVSCDGDRDNDVSSYQERSWRRIRIRQNQDNNCRILVLLGLQESMFLVHLMRISLTQASIFDDDND